MVIDINKVKGQMKIQQTAFMLIALTLFFALVGLFFVSYTITGINRGALELEQKNAMLLVSRLANSPEFACGEVFGGKTRVNCIDSDKAMVLKENAYRYRRFWGVTDIKIRTIYPEKEEIECYESNYPNCNVISIIEERIVGNYDSTYVTLCRKEPYNNYYIDKCELAKLMVSYGNSDEE
jgi:hypothetical protein